MELFVTYYNYMIVIGYRKKTVIIVINILYDTF